MLKVNFHFDRLKLSSKTVRKLLLNESYCFNDAKSLDEMLFSKIQSVCVPVYFCILNLMFSLQDIIRWQKMYIDRTVKCLKRLQKRSINDNLRQLVLLGQDRVLVN